MANHHKGNGSGGNGRKPKMGLDELQSYVESLDVQAYLASDAIEAIMETKALSAFSGRKGFNVEGGVAEKPGKCGICGQRIMAGDYIRSLIVMDSRRRTGGGYPGLAAYPFHDECSMRLLLYMFPQALLSKVVAMGDCDDDTIEAIYDPEARKELIEKVLDHYFEEHGEGCDCENCG